MSFTSVQFSSVVQSCPTLCDPHGLKHTRLPCSSSTPRACSDLCPSSRWCHPTTSYSVVPFSSRLQSFPASWSFPRSQFFTSDGQSYWSFSFSISPSNEYSGLISFRMVWLDLLAVQGTLKSLLQHHSSKPAIFRLPHVKHQYQFYINFKNINSMSFTYEVQIFFKKSNLLLFYFLLFTGLWVSCLRTPCLTPDIISQKHQFQNVTYCIIPFIWHS